MAYLVAAFVLAGAYVLLCLVYYIIQERIIFVRRSLRRRYRYRFKHAHHELWLRAGDGAKLHALHFPAEDATGVVLYFHGNTGTLRRWGKRAPRFTRFGHAVVMPEPRGYGKSRGRLSEQALLSDALLWYDELRRQWPEDRIVVYGRSLGSALAIPVAAQRSPRSLVLESPFARLIDAARSYFRWLPYGMLLKYRFANDEAIARVRCPVHIFHGEQDEVVPFASAKRLFARVPKDVERALVAFPKGHHNDLARFARYHRALRALLGGGAPVQG